MKKVENLLLCVGAQKAGTSWLYEVLKGDSEIEFSKFKEIHYFDMKHSINNQLQRRISNELAKTLNVNKKRLNDSIFSSQEDANVKIKNLLSDRWYSNQFESNKKYFADFTPEYALLDKSGFEHIKKISEKQKIIFIMRDPVKRSLSALQYFFQNRNIDISTISDSDLIKKINSNLILPRSKYEVTIKQLLNSFSKDDVHFIFYEDVMSNKEDSIEKLYEFLDLKKPKIGVDTLEKKVNSSKTHIFSNNIVNHLNAILSNTISDVEKFIGYVPDSWGIKETK